jgi:hypothetical protein
MLILPEGWAPWCEDQIEVVDHRNIAYLKEVLPYEIPVRGTYLLSIILFDCFQVLRWRGTRFRSNNLDDFGHQSATLEQRGVLLRESY